MSFGTYRAYRQVETNWVPVIPAHWSIQPARRLFRQRRDASLPGDEQLSATQRYGVIPQSQFMAQEDQKVVLALGGVDNFKHVEPDDFVISLRSFQGGIERSRHAGCVSPAYTVLRPAGGLVPGYWEYLLKSSQFIAALQTTTDGIRDGKNISYAQFGSLPLPLAPVEEQHAIASFLDREAAKIDALIAEQEKLIALLAEKRQATISHAVTRGLNPNAPMKDSGVPWLGEVPAHWEIRPLKYLVALKSGGTPSKERFDFWTDGHIPWASAKDLKSEVLHDTADHLTTLALQEGAADLVGAGAALVVVRGMILGRMFPVSVAGVPMAINQDLKAVTPVNGLTSSYLPWLLRGSADETLRRLDEAGHGTKALRMDAWLTMKIPVPPTQEQETIVSQLSDRLRVIDALLLRSCQANDLLQERRSALIAAAVTGQIDVRDTQALPIQQSEAIPA